MRENEKWGGPAKVIGKDGTTVTEKHEGIN